MTIVNVLMSGGMFGEDTTGQGKLTINNEVIANKYLSDNDFANSINAFNALSQQIPALSAAPLFMSENGKSAFYMPVEGVGEYLIDPIEALTSIQAYASGGGDLTNQQNIVGLLIGASILDDNPINGLFAADNQYITLYYMGAAITLEYYNLAN